MITIRSLPVLLLVGWRHTSGTPIGQLAVKTLAGIAVAFGLLRMLGLG